MLAGLGQFAIIVRARLRLVAAPPNTRFYVAPYDDLSVFMSDLLRLNDDGRFDTVQGFAVPDPAGGWTYSLEATSNFAPGSEPDDAELFLPGDQAEGFIGDTLAELTVDDVGQGPVAIYPYRRNSFARPFLRLPNTDVVFLFALLRNAIPPTPERAAELVEDNRQLFEAAASAGGFSYPIDSVPKTRVDWHRHYGPLWPAFALAKRFYDPDEILAPGQGIFGAP